MQNKQEKLLREFIRRTFVSNLLKEHREEHAVRMYVRSLISEVKEETLEEYLTKPVQTTNLLEFSDEEPYIYDQKQIGF